MKKIAHSLGYSIAGLIHAIKSEKNLRHFLLAHILLMLTGIWFRIDFFSLVILTIMACFFVIVELLNTALERLADTIDDIEKTHRGGHYHHGIKLTKDVAAAASLVALLLYGITVLLIALPYVLYALQPVA